MIYVLTAVLVITADQAVKYMTRTMMRPGETIQVIGSFFQITYVKNDGAAFGIFSGHSRLLLVVPLIVVVAALLFVFLDRRADPLAKYSVVLIAAGGAGNLIDRAVFGEVTDMFSFSIFPPVFNVADISVTVGCILVLLYVFFGEKLERKKEGRRTKKRRSRQRKPAG